MIQTWYEVNDPTADNRFLDAPITIHNNIINVTTDYLVYGSGGKRLRRHRYLVATWAEAVALVKDRVAEAQQNITENLLLIGLGESEYIKEINQ